VFWNDSNAQVWVIIGLEHPEDYELSFGAFASF
jgi:hypothetical protein